MNILCTAVMFRAGLLQSATSLVREVCRRTRSCDNNMFTLGCYINSALGMDLFSHTGDPTQYGRLLVFAGSDVSWNMATSTSTTGLCLGFWQDLARSHQLLQYQQAMPQSAIEAEVVATEYAPRVQPPRVRGVPRHRRRRGEAFGAWSARWAGRAGWAPRRCPPSVCKARWLGAWPSWPSLHSDTLHLGHVYESRAFMLERAVCRCAWAAVAAPRSDLRMASLSAMAFSVTMLRLWRAEPCARGERSHRAACTARPPLRRAWLFKVTPCSTCSLVVDQGRGPSRRLNSAPHGSEVSIGGDGGAPHGIKRHLTPGRGVSGSASTWDSR